MEVPSYNNLTCHQTQLKISLYIESDPYLTDEEHKAFKAHLESCPECAREYEESRFIISLVKRYWTASEDTLSLIEKANQSAKPQMTIEEGWEDLKRHIPELAQLENRQERLRLFRRIGAVAACFIVGVSILLAFSYSKPEIAQEPVVEQVTSIPKPYIKVEIISESGNIPIPADHRITTAEQLKTLIINDKHRLIMNANTALSVRPFSQDKRLGCMVDLASGQIYAHIEHDGNPFIVSTAHGQVIITGTTFDVRATDASTILVVADGSVKFESEKGIVEVPSSQISKIIANSAPTRPVSCNVAELTAWATAYELKLALAKIQSISDDYDLADLWPSVSSGPIELGSINYYRWIKEKRAWFKQEFPWIFQLRDTLAKEGIEVDYPELLISSGDIWQFVYPETSPRQIPILCFDPLLKTASKYGFDEQWLTANIPTTKPAIYERAAARDRFVGPKAFEQWTTCLKKAQRSSEELGADILLYSVHAGAYLANTKTLAWLCIKNGGHSLRAENQVEVLDLLQNEVNAANKLTIKAINLLWTSRQSQPCDKYSQLISDIIENIGEIKGVEEKIAVYEIIK